MIRNLKLITISFAILATAFSASAQYRNDGYASINDSETVASMKEHVSYIASAQMEGRKPGSEGERLAAEYLHEVLSGYGVDMLSPYSGDEFGIAVGNDTIVSRNVIGFVQGYDKSLKDEYVVVGARLDNIGTTTMNVDGTQTESIYYGANGNASGLAVLAELGRMVATNSILFRRSVVFVAFGASSESFAGSWYFIDRQFKDKVTVMFNLDMLGGGTENKFYAYTGSNLDMNAMLNTMKGSLQPVFPEVTTAEAYPSDHRTFYAKEIPAVHFTTGRYSGHNTPKDTPSTLDYEGMERELEYIYNFLKEIANTSAEIQFKREPVDEKKKAEYGSNVMPYYECDQKPMFSNSPDIRKFMTDWVYRLLKYPQSAVEEGVQGTVQVNFIIDKTGAVKDVTVVRSIDPRLDDEAVKVVSASPKWKPARVKGTKVDCAMTIGVEFRLQKKSDKHRRFGINGY